MRLRPAYGTPSAWRQRLAFAEVVARMTVSAVRAVRPDEHIVPEPVDIPWIELRAVEVHSRQGGSRAWLGGGVQTKQFWLRLAEGSDQRLLLEAVSGARSTTWRVPNTEPLAARRKSCRLALRVDGEELGALQVWPDTEEALEMEYALDGNEVLEARLLWENDDG